MYVVQRVEDSTNVYAVFVASEPPIDLTDVFRPPFSAHLGSGYRPERRCFGAAAR